MYHDHHAPCLHCHPQSYIRMVQHLIERCLLLRMSQDGCVKALAERASIEPLIVLTVWRELVKENRGFFHAYSRQISPRQMVARRDEMQKEKLLQVQKLSSATDHSRKCWQALEAASSPWCHHH